MYDAQGDIIGLLNASGALAQTIRYGPYGENATTTGSKYTPTVDPFLFKGGYHVSPSTAESVSVPNGAYHFGERYYDPTAGRWTQQDPEDHLGSPTQGDRFAFAGDDPMNRSDPAGTSIEGEIVEGWEDFEEVAHQVTGIPTRKEAGKLLKCFEEVFHKGNAEYEDEQWGKYQGDQGDCDPLEYTGAGKVETAE